MKLPGVLQEIAEAAGIEAALAVAREKGGGRASFSPDPREDHWLSRLLGMAAARQICAALTAGHIRVELDIPLGPHGTYRQQRRARAVALKAAADGGLSLNAGARAAGVDRSSFRRFRARRKASGKRRQLSLFED